MTGFSFVSVEGAWSQVEEGLFDCARGVKNDCGVGLEKVEVFWRKVEKFSPKATQY